MANSISSKFSELPMWAKGTIAVIGVVSIIAIGLWLRKGIKNYVENKDEREAERDISNSANQALNDLEQQGVQPTLSDLDAQTLSNTIQTLLDGCELSGSEKLVVDSILPKINNQADWVKLQQVFGRRKIDNCGIGTGSTDYDLKGLLTDQLDAVDWSFSFYSTVLKKGLEKKGITF